MTPQFLPTTLKYRGYFAQSRPDGRWTLKGRGQRSVVTHAELLGLLHAPKRKQPGAPKQ